MRVCVCTDLLDQVADSELTKHSDSHNRELETLDFKLVSAFNIGWQVGKVMESPIT